MKLMKEPGRKATAPGRGLVPASGPADTAYVEYLDELDPKGQSDRSRHLRHSLAISTDIRFNEFLRRLSQPRYRTYHLATIAKTCDIGLPEFADFWQKAQHMRTLARAQEGAVEVMSDVVSDARTKQVSCDRCDGLGFVWADELSIALQKSKEAQITTGTGIEARQIRACPLCGGTCTVTRPGDTDARKMVFDAAGVGTRKGPSVVVGINNYGGAGIESAVDKMSSVTFDIEAEDGS